MDNKRKLSYALLVLFSLMQIVWIVILFIPSEKESSILAGWFGFIGNALGVLLAIVSLKEPKKIKMGVENSKY